MGPIKPSLLFFTLLISFFSSSFAETVPGSSNAGISWDAQSDIDYDNHNATNISTQDGYYSEPQVIAHLSSKLQTCIRQTPLDHGLFFHIEDKSGPSVDQRLFKRGMLGSISNGWKGMPFDQKLSVVGAIASTASVPMYLMGAGVGFNELEIGNFKDKLLHRPDNQTHHHRPKYGVPPPPPLSISPKMFRKRSWKESVQDVVKLVRRGVKKPNENVARAMGMVNAANAILYLSTAAVAAARIMTVRDGDTTAYKRSLPLELKGFTVTCIPVEKIGDMDYQIAKGAFTNMAQEMEPRLTFVQNKDASDVASPVKTTVEVKTADLSNGHHRVLVKRAVIPLQGREEDHRKEEDLDSFQSKEITSKGSQHDEKTSSSNNESNPSSPDEGQLVRRNGGALHPAGEPGHVPLDGPIEVEKIKHIYHVDGKHLDLPDADGSGKWAKKGSMSKGSMLGYAAGGAFLGYGIHALYSNNQQEQMIQQQQQAAAFQAAQAAQAGYGYADEQGYRYAAKRDEQSQEDAMVKRANVNDDSDILFTKRSPNGGPDIRLSKSEVHWHNVPPEKLPAGAKFHGQNSNPNAGSNSAEYGYDGNSYQQEYGAHSSEMKKKGGSNWGKKALILAAAAGTGAYVHATFSPPPPLPPIPMAPQMAYGDEYAQEYAQPTYYQKREVFHGQTPPSFAVNDSKGDLQSTSSSDQPASQDVLKREETSYDDYIKAFKAAEEEEEKAVKGQSLKPRKRDQIQYDSGKGNMHFVASKSVDASKKAGEEEELEEELERRDIYNEDELLYRRESTVQFDSGKDHGSHFRASVPSYPYGDVVDDEGDEKLQRRSESATITYDGTSDGQHFSASAPEKEAAKEDKDDEELERRSEASSVVYDHNKDGTHFVASHPGSSPSQVDDDDDDEEELERRNYDGKPCDKCKAKDQNATKIDYTTSKDNEINFHASTPLVASTPLAEEKQKDNVKVDAHYEKDTGVVIKIAPRSQQSTGEIGMVRRNQIVADR